MGVFGFIQTARHLYKHIVKLGHFNLQCFLRNYPLSSRFSPSKMIVGMIWQWIGMDLTAPIGLREVLRLIRMILDIEKGVATVFGLNGYLFGPL